MGKMLLSSLYAWETESSLETLQTKNICKFFSLSGKQNTRMKKNMPRKLKRYIGHKIEST